MTLGERNTKPYLRQHDHPRQPSVFPHHQGLLLTFLFTVKIRAVPDKQDKAYSCFFLLFFPLPWTQLCTDVCLGYLQLVCLLIILLGDIKVLKVPDEDQDLRMWDSFQLSEEGVVCSRNLQHHLLVLTHKVSVYGLSLTPRQSSTCSQCSLSHGAVPSSHLLPMEPVANL